MVFESAEVGLGQYLGVVPSFGPLVNSMLVWSQVSTWECGEETLSVPAGI